MSILMVIAVTVATLAIFATTTRGREIAKKVGFRDRVAGAASTEDVEFLLNACDGDSSEAARRVANERERLSELTEAEHYRRAIRKVLREREHG